MYISHLRENFQQHRHCETKKQCCEEVFNVDVRPSHPGVYFELGPQNTEPFCGQNRDAISKNICVRAMCAEHKFGCLSSCQNCHRLSIILWVRRHSEARLVFMFHLVITSWEISRNTKRFVLNTTRIWIIEFGWDLLILKL